MVSPVLTERRWSGSFLVSEDQPGERSRDQVTLKQQGGGTVLDGGTVLGKIGPSTGAPVSAANGGNTGNGVMGAVTESAGAIVGVYKLVVVAAVVNSGIFELFDPNGAFIGQGKVATLFAGGGLSFTLADGAADFVAGDGFTITVAANADANKYVPVNLAGVDGSQNAAAILFNSPFDVTAADTKQTVITRHAEVNGSELTYPAGATAPQIAALNAQLVLLGIIVR